MTDLPQVQLYLADCLDKLPEIETGSVDAVITDPPYPCIKRSYGTWTVDEWWEMIVEGVVPEVRRILKPTGSAVFILQPNSEHVGQMRGWLWEFMAWVCREWNMVQDVWWWNTCAMPVGGCTPRERGLLRASVKACVWAGAPNCYREQENVLWTASQRVKFLRKANRINNGRRKIKGGTDSINDKAAVEASGERGGVTPYNILPFPNANSQSGPGAYGNYGGTPLPLADWWTRYICPLGGTACDPFLGSGTMGVAAVKNGCNFVGIEKLDEPGYFPTAQERIAEELAKPRQTGMEL